MQLEKKHDMRCKFAPATTSTCPRSTNTTTLHIAHSHYHIFTWPYTHVPGNDLIQTQNQKHCKDSFHLLNWKLKLLLILNWNFCSSRVTGVWELRATSPRTSRPITEIWGVRPQPVSVVIIMIRIKNAGWLCISASGSGTLTRWQIAGFFNSLLSALFFSQQNLKSQMYFCMYVIPMLKVQQRLFQVGMEVQRLTRALPLSIVSSHLKQNKLECYDFDLLSQQIIDVFFWFLLASSILISSVIW